MANFTKKSDDSYMELAIKEAVKALGRTSPNPLVGALIVKNSEIISTGYHQKAGTPHAEINALNSCKESYRGATMFVTLEPCNHQGRTPPCTHAIVKSGIKRVVVGMIDPNPLVAGKGIDYLRSNNIEVVSGICAEECRSINLPFIKWITQKSPYVTMKAGLSLDGKIATSTGHSGWITNHKSRRFVHKIRDRVDGILVGIGTALADDPSLTTRLPGDGHQDPTRIILDSRLRLPDTAKMLHLGSKAPTLIYCGPDADSQQKLKLENAGAQIKAVPVREDGQLDLKVVLKNLAKKEITSLLVEGGSQVHSSFLNNGLVDQVNLFYGSFFLGSDGISVVGKLGLDRVDQAKKLVDLKTRRFGDDIMVKGFFIDS